MSRLDWSTALATYGISVLPPTSYVPAEVYGHLPDGRGLRFRCRGTRISLQLFAAEDVQLAAPIYETTPTELPLLLESRVPLAGARIVERDLVRLIFTGSPAAMAEIDGAERFGWTRYEAGLLSTEEALALLPELMGRLGLAGESAVRREPVGSRA
jgi:hypothetical protein